MGIFSSALDRLSGPFGKFALAMMSGRQDQAGSASATAANEARYRQALGIGEDAMRGGMATYDAGAQQQLGELQRMQSRGVNQGQGLFNDVMGLMGNRTAGVMGRFDQSANQLQQGYGAGMDQFNQAFQGASDKINQGYQDRYAQASDQIEGYGRQQTADIDRRYDAEQAVREQSLIDRGLMSSTSGQGDILGVNERRIGEQRRHQEGLMQNRVNVLSQLSGDSLNAQERMRDQGAGFRFGGMNNQYQMGGQLQNARAAYDAALSGDEASTRASMGQWQQSNEQNLSNNLSNFFGGNAMNRANMFNQGMGNMQNLVTGRTDAYSPQNNAIAQAFGMNAPRVSRGDDGGEKAMYGQLGGAAIGMLPMLFSDAGGKAPASGGGYTGDQWSGSFGVWSDKRSKEGFTVVDGDKVLAGVKDLPVSLWRYKADPTDTVHIGPMAQDFKSAFQVGDSDRHIHGVDAIGVLISSVQTLAEKVERLEKAVA